MGGLVDRTEPVSGQMSVDLRRSQIGVAEQLLHGAEVRSALEEMGGVRVAERVRVQRPAVGERVSVQDPPRVTR
jgi:hypothetical protein